MINTTHKKQINYNKTKLLANLSEISDDVNDSILSDDCVKKDMKIINNDDVKAKIHPLSIKLRDLNDSYKYRYQEYEMMAEEVTIQSAIELYADDATQVDTKTERIVNIQSDDKTLQQDLNDFLESISVDSNIGNAQDTRTSMQKKYHNSPASIDYRTIAQELCDMK